ncbi:hypothetical protein HYW21_02545 [Candidatus Woesearchaeota archaeon]|nr:hypothetical protein [Candidatus Woesearchaeota archaeon]
MATALKERVIGATGSVSGIASILGSWQICHNVCLGIIALLGIIGITLTGMPLQFLTTIALPLWTMALLLLGITMLMYAKKKCISRNLILINTGLIIAGVPFQSVQSFIAVFWVIGGIVALSGIVLFVKEKIQQKRCHTCE